ncbi:hypothetical protein B0J14DRAFT_555196 [Halenospora varia]|nr:hypothetical protein B0J14DRAFT_555196 [Halenospora varia]
MRAARNLQLYSIILLFLTTFTAAWPWPRWLPELDTLVVRQNNQNSNSASATQTQSGSATATATDSQQSASNTGSATKGSQTGSQTGSNTGTITSAPSSTGGSSSDSNSTDTSSYHTSYDAQSPAGGISMLIPAATATTYYKIGDYVTFAWNYTSLLGSPTAVNVLATCTANQALYTLAPNVTVSNSNSTNQIIWDTADYQANHQAVPLLTQTYTLIIYDAASSISATAEPGYLAVYNQFTFGMYLPQPYTPLSDYTCATCSGALGDMERRAIAMVFGVGAVTVLSFTWFVTGTGVIW